MAAALFLSTLVHGAVLVTLAARPSVPPETVHAGRLSVSLQGSSAEGGTTADDRTMPAPTPSLEKQVKAPEPASPPERQIASRTGSEPGSAKAANEPPAGARASEQRTLAQNESVAESSPATTTAPGRDKSAAEPGKTAPAAARLDMAESAAASAHGTESAETENPPMVAADVAAPAVAPGARKAVQARLEDELARHFHYPFLARRRGWEGKVVLRLHIDGRGRIDSTEIAGSSGHGILDRAALEAVAKVALVPGVAERLGGIGLYLELPVIYRLREG